MKAWGYVRVSGAAQVETGHGLDVQRARIAAWSTYQGVELVAVEADEGVSGAATDNRPGLRRVLRSALGAGKDATLVVYKLDRLGRSALDVQEIVGTLLDAGVRVVSIADGVDSASGLGGAVLKLLVSILSTFAELEKETIRGRLLDGRKRAKAERRVYGPTPALGLRLSDIEAGTLIDDEAELRAIDRAKALRAEGLTYREVASRLDAEGHRPRKAATWSNVTIMRLCEGRRTAAKKSSKRTERVRRELLDGAE